MSVPEGLAVSIPGNELTIVFPTAMFLPDGKMLHRLHRSRALRNMAELYDQLAERARQRCITEDPKTERPPLEQLGMQMFDVIVAKGAEGGTDAVQIEEPGEGSVQRRPRKEDAAERPRVGKRNARRDQKPPRARQKARGKGRKKRVR